MRFLLAERPLRNCKEVHSLPSLFVFGPPAVQPPTWVKGRILTDSAITLIRKNAWVQRHPPPRTLRHLKQTEDVDDETDVVDRFSIYVEQSDGDWQKDDSI